MISIGAWLSLKWLKQTDFTYPDQLDWSVVWAYEQLCEKLGCKPQFLSDFRYDDAKQHGNGRAIDSYWPDLDPLLVWNTALGLRVFSGLGTYVNEEGVVSFHFDTRVTRTVANPATWGGFITHPVNLETGRLGKDIRYTAAGNVLAVIGKATGAGAILAVGLLVYGLIRSA